MKLWRNQEIEDQTLSRLAELERKVGRPVSAPIPVEFIAEQVCHLDFLYDRIVEQPGQCVLGALRSRTIVVNENHRPAFDSKPGLERFSVGHEIGHWDLYARHADTRTGWLFGEPETSQSCRTVSGLIAECIPNLWRDDDSYELIQHLGRGCDSPTEASAVDRYSSALLMPRALLRAFFAGRDIADWRCLYEACEHFGVTISALKARLERLGWIHVTNAGEVFPGSAAEHAGQMKVPF